MKMNKKIIGITGGVILACGICVFGVIAKATNNPDIYSEIPKEVFEKYSDVSKEEFEKMSPEKQAFEKRYIEKQRKADEDSKKYTPLPIPTMDRSILTQDISEFGEIGVIREASQHDLPMSSMEEQGYVFDTAASLKHNSIVTGKSNSNPANGVIYNFYSNLNKGIQPSRNVHVIPNVGNITITGVDVNKNIFTFKTESGRTGVFDVSNDIKGVYRLD